MTRCLLMIWFPSSFQGCYEKVEEWLDDNKHLLGTIAMCVLVIQVSSTLSGGHIQTLNTHRVCAVKQVQHIQDVICLTFSGLQNHKKLNKNSFKTFYYQLRLCAFKDFVRDPFPNSREILPQATWRFCLRLLGLAGCC